MVYLRRYGLATTLDFSLVKRDVADLAVSADWTPVAGDVKINKDGGADANVATLPSAPASTTAKWIQPLAASELSAARAVLTVIDQGTKAVEDWMLIVETYGHPLSQHPKLAPDIIYTGQVTGAATIQTLIDSGLNQADVNHWVNRIVIFATGNLTYESTRIITFNPSNDQIQFESLTQAPQTGDRYYIV